MPPAASVTLIGLAPIPPSGPLAAVSCSAISPLPPEAEAAHEADGQVVTTASSLLVRPASAVCACPTKAGPAG